MSDKDFTKDKDGLQKMRDLIEVPKVVMMASRLDKIPFSVCPMTLQSMDAQGDLWFFTSKESGLFKDVDYDNRVQIMCSDEEKQKYISIFGNATHIVDQEKVDELWNPLMRNWFDGKEDPNLVLLNVNMENAYYWDNQYNKLVSFFKLVKGAIPEQQPNMGDKGHIDLQDH
ncbi:pyridoxamine 5'-phosphate oxidase family protein [Mariniflexile ostreae]|uniref:Pyridoxamine 5'-phosphate oxidase family protein n=1 Tax=Mariniflexile ostreae TaxID=1520892 RepID=A0ABV5F8R9_9FLAO